jgi:prepilin-type N-terminal cleavage/methylation domain-containing protein
MHRVMIKTKTGYTLIELLITVSIIAILIIGALFTLNRQRDRADDARVKAELDRLKIAFEEYHNDHGCYPPAEWFDSVDDCGSNQLSPYLGAIPCDRNTGLPYVLETDETSCTWYKLYARLDRPERDDQAVAQRSSTGSTKGNYGVSSANVTVSVYYESPESSAAASSTPSPSSPSPSPEPSPNSYWC